MNCWKVKKQFRCRIKEEKMNQSVTSQYVLLVNSKEINLNSIVALDSYVATLSAGIYELEKNEIIHLSEISGNDTAIDLDLAKNMKIDIMKELPPELAYLRILYNTLVQSEKRTLYDLIRAMTYDLKTNNSYNYVDDLMKYLVKEEAIEKVKKKGLFGKLNEVYRSDENIVKSVKEDLMKDFSERIDSVILAFLLDKTHMLDMLYTKGEVKQIRDNLEKVKSVEGNVLNTMNMMNNIILLLFAFMVVLN